MVQTIGIGTDRNLTAQAVTAERAATVDLSKDSEMCLVVSDMENSTLLSVENPAAFAASQDIHDAVMVELIQQFYGLELLREGDSFRVAFKRPEEAVAFCLKVGSPKHVTCPAGVSQSTRLMCHQQTVYGKHHRRHRGPVCRSSFVC